jgi:hypothetical protein
MPFVPVPKAVEFRNVDLNDLDLGCEIAQHLTDDVAVRVPDRNLPTHILGDPERLDYLSPFAPRRRQGVT